MSTECKAGCSEEDDSPADPGLMAIEVSVFRTSTTNALTS